MTTLEKLTVALIIATEVERVPNYREMDESFAKRLKLPLDVAKNVCVEYAGTEAGTIECWMFDEVRRSF